MSNKIAFSSIVIVFLVSIFSGCIDETTTAPPTPISESKRIVYEEPDETATAKTTEIVIIEPTVVVTYSSTAQDQQNIDQSSEFNRNFQRKFSWNFEEKEWYLILNLDEGTYNEYKNRSRSRNYDLFASDPYDDKLIVSISDTLKKVGKDNGLTDLEIPYLAISFVQSLPYTSDKVTTDFDEYPRFPYETLYDDGGDCEDTSILSAAILQEMGYGVVLIELPKHMAVGVKCDSAISGYSYDFEGQRYCYLETTGENWPIGQLPDEYKTSKAKIIPVYTRPFLDIKFTSNYQYNSKDVFVNVDVTAKNLGSEEARNTKIYVSLQTSDTSKVWSQIESSYIQIQPEGSYTYNVKNLHAPTGRNFRIYVRAYGDNVLSGEAIGNWVTWTQK